MQTRQLEYLVVVARTGNFRKAAEETFVSQPALSEAIQKLEAELGLVLIERDRRFLGLTPEGLRVVEAARRVLEAGRDLRDLVGMLHQGLTGTLQLAAIATALVVLPRVTTPFSARHPGVTISIRANMAAHDIHQALLSYEADAALSYVDEVPDGLVGTPLFREPYVLAGARAAIPADWMTGGVAPASLVGLPLVALSRTNRARRILDEQLAASGVKLTPTITVDSISTIYAHVTAGHWYGLLPRSWAGPLSGSDALVTAPLRLPDPPPIGVLMRADGTGRPLVRALLETLPAAEV